jgi:hypothetical protein
MAEITLERMEEIANPDPQPQLLEYREQVQFLERRNQELQERFNQAQDRLAEVSIELANTFRENRELHQNATAQETGPWLTIMGWHRKRNIAISHDDCKPLGQAVARLCREMGIGPRKVHHDIYGYMNKYPEEIITYYIEGRWPERDNSEE